MNIVVDSDSRCSCMLRETVTTTSILGVVIKALELLAPRAELVPQRIWPPPLIHPKQLQQNSYIFLAGSSIAFLLSRSRLTLQLSFYLSINPSRCLLHRYAFDSSALAGAFARIRSTSSSSTSAQCPDDQHAASLDQEQVSCTDGRMGQGSQNVSHYQVWRDIHTPNKVEAQQWV